MEIACGRLVTGTALIEKEEKDVSPQNRVKNAQQSRKEQFFALDVNFTKIHSQST